MKILITGANRGIGLELTRLYLAEGKHVISTARNISKATSLLELEEQFGSRFKLLPLEVADTNSVAEFKSSLTEEPIDLLINNAGVLEKPESWFDEVAMQKSWDINAVGPLRVIEACLNNLEKGTAKKIVNVSSIMASIKYTQPDNMPYRVSKAALNMATQMLARQLEEKKFCVVALHPGWVKTDMGGSEAPTSPRESAEAIANIIAPLTPEDSGRFLNALKPEKDIPW